MDIAADLLEQIVEHARREAPNECCGLIAVRDGRAVEVFEAENVAASPFRFEIDGKELLELTQRIDDAGADLAIYHSHTRSDPIPSQTDMNFAALWPGAEWLIIGVAGGGEPDIRHWRIVDGEAEQAEVRVGAA
ncbi:Mov34/MPN/PAD-1 family protein [Conexibacter sp. SYSU D00693]|uniref:Mov34/MPN/PAD-1 family protein n=1 Tax=Conexibacter sp. SYSU D00693 TaxID=2812560 RepID=UPI00196A34DE|nr:M67 family metallopeptidase [Conexibacter sp. SYSU D00693]